MQSRHRFRQRHWRIAAGLTLALIANPASAASKTSPSNSSGLTSTSRTEKLDGTANVTISRRIPAEWEAKLGADFSIAPPAGLAPSDNLENILKGTMPNRSSGTVWGNLSMPGVQQLGWDKASVDARIDPGKEQGKVGATLSRSVPIGEKLSVTLRHSYSVTQTIAGNEPPAPDFPLLVRPATDTSGAAATSTTWGSDRSLRVNIHPTGTVLSAASATSSADDHWHNKLSIEQNLLGPLKMTVSVENPGAETSNKSIVAGFKHNW